MHRKSKRSGVASVALGLASIFLSAGPLSTASGQEAPALAVDFNREVRPILAEFCFSCHGNDASHRQADLRLDQREAVIESGVIVPGDPLASLLVQRITSTDSDLVMPPPESRKVLPQKHQETLRRWVAEGAPYSTHWAFIPPRASPPQAASGASVIDSFIDERLKPLRIQRSLQASPTTLMRRVSLDLVGLPPTLEQIDAFLELWNRNPDLAYERWVDRLLASPQYGERWGRWWLDQARYADSNGYSVDAPRQIWAFRDWVIEAFNADLPFDQFTFEQLAGDLLPERSRAQQIATGFHRNTPLNEEGGIDKEQYRIDSIFDRVATTATVWLGLTIGCAQCHDHKFDPISQREYYELFAFLNNQEEPSVPTLSDAEIANRSLEPRSVPTTLVLRERTEPRKTLILVSGDFTRPSEEVFPGTPAVLHSMDEIAGSPAESRKTRLDLARWLVSDRNPLTARVLVNRVWQHFFGRGFVATESDFGLQGTLPTHPELLDSLALELIHKQWSLKAIQRMIVMSETYRQSSQQREDLQQLDPDNQLVARQRRLRLDAEVIRDGALAVSQLLVLKMHGPPVFPPIPEGVMEQAQVKRPWNASQGEDGYRRTIYTFIYRGAPPPMLSIFDAPEGLGACTQRLRSNTPLQSLTLMNDQGFVQCAAALGGFIEKTGIESAFRQTLGRRPAESELQVLHPLDPLTAARVLLNLDETITRE